jgi:hypothetical protein
MDGEVAERTAIIVIGMHRSGSSAMARLLSLAGAALPKTLMAAGHGNEAGHWEPQRVADYNDVVLAAFDAVWDSPFGLGASAERRIVLDSFVEGARAIIREEYADAPLIVLKEPRISLVADLWTRACEAEGLRCKFIIMVRPPTEVALSLRKRNGFALDKGLLLWGAYQASSDQLTRSHDRTFCQYDDLLARPASVLDDIEAKLRIELPRRSAPAQAEMDAFVRPELKHNNASFIPAIPHHLKPISALADYIHALMAGEVPNIDVSRGLQDWFSDLDRTITPLIIEISQRLQAERDSCIAATHAQIEASRVEMAQINALYEQQLAEVARLNAAFVAMVEGLRDAEDRVTESEDARRAMQAHLDHHTAEAAALREEIGAATADLAASADANARLIAEHAHATAEHAAALTLVEARHREALAVEYGASEAREAALTATVESVRGAHEALAGEASALRDALAESEVTVATLRAALGQAEGDAAAREADLRQDIVVLQAAMHASKEREAEADRVIADLTVRAETQVRTLGAEIAEALGERDRMRDEIARLHTVERQMASTADALTKTISHKDEALNSYVGQIDAMTNTVAELQRDIAVQAQAFALEALQSREREDRAKTALLAEIQARNDDFVARQSVVHRIKLVFTAPSKSATGDRGR